MIFVSRKGAKAQRIGFLPRLKISIHPATMQRRKFLCGGKGTGRIGEQKKKKSAYLNCIGFYIESGDRC